MEHVGFSNLGGKEFSMNSTKIALITNICSHYHQELFEVLSKKYQIRFYFTGGEESYWERKNLWDIKGLQAKRLKGIFILPKIKISLGLFTLWRKKEFDIFIKTIDDRFALIFVFLTAKIFKKPFILWTGLWAHPQTVFHKISFLFTRFIYRHSEAIIVYGEHVKKYLVNLGIDPGKIFCASHATSNSVYNRDISEAEKLELKQSLSVGRKKVILYVGRLEKCKGINYLIEALSELRALNPLMFFIGSGKERQILEEECRKHALVYLFLEHIPNSELYRYYAIADIFVLPSITTPTFKEPWGMVINEAMNQACPVIATDAVGAAMGGLIDNGINGLVVAERNSLALRGAIETVLKDDHMRYAMGKSAKKKIEGWTPQKTSEGFYRAVEYVLGQQR